MAATLPLPGLSLLLVTSYHSATGRGLLYHPSAKALGNRGSDERAAGWTREQEGHYVPAAARNLRYRAPALQKGKDAGLKPGATCAAQRHEGNHEAKVQFDRDSVFSCDCCGANAATAADFSRSPFRPSRHVPFPRAQRQGSCRFLRRRRETVAHAKGQCGRVERDHRATRS